ncbi:aldose epimerase family protein [Streptomyces buecherae]|uniref:aldose epimerase family protein n=1 Tax=Streptomyces buecherae TaxID=2763006 RepID=UPI001C26C492|nr:aldose 1-epimerase [Streptomyces buecherae]
MSTQETTDGAPGARDVRLVAPGFAELTIRPEDGCRISSLIINDLEVLRQGDRYGSFPMAPWCGRIELGQFRSFVTAPGGGDGAARSGGVRHQMPINATPHAIHGTVRDQPWRAATVDDQSATFYCDLTDPWPYRGRVTHTFELTDDALTLTMGVESRGDSFPAQAGWHPWFLRQLGPTGAPVQIAFDPAWQEERGVDHLPTGRRVEPGPGPWDDCFGMPDGVDVTLTWPTQLELTITSGAEWVVVYDEQEEAVCVEPQSGPPNGLNTVPRLVTPIDPLEVSTTWRWKRF